MRIKNKYIRNRSFHVKYWNHIRHQTNPYEHTHGSWYCTIEERVKSHFEWISQQSRAIESGCHKGIFHATSKFRRALDREKKAKVRVAMQKILNGDYDIEIPRFKKDADWLYF
jgi:hypothetical protein